MYVALKGIFANNLVLSYIIRHQRKEIIFIFYILFLPRWCHDAYLEQDTEFANCWYSFTHHVSARSGPVSNLTIQSSARSISLAWVRPEYLSSIFVADNELSYIVTYHDEKDNRQVGSENVAPGINGNDYWWLLIIRGVIHLQYRKGVLAVLEIPLWR